MKARAPRYSDDGKITLLLYPENTNMRSVGDFSRDTLLEYLGFPATTQLSIYCIDNDNFEEVIALIRFVKSLYNVDIFCYHNRDLAEERVTELSSFVPVIVKIGV